MARIPLPLPSGIFAVARSAEIGSEKIKSVCLGGEDLALFRTKQGQIAAVAAHCPHLGAHIPSGGKVRGEFIQCPFHGLYFDTRGNCKTASDKQSCLKLKSWKASEKYGLVFLEQEGRNIPTLPDWDMSHWSRPIYDLFKIRSHPQEILENSIDILHFIFVHHYSDIQLLSPIETTSTEFKIAFSLKRSKGLFGPLEKQKIEIQLAIHIFGLSISFADIFLPKYNLRARQVVLPTPIDSEQIEIRTITSIGLNKNTQMRRIFANLIAWIAHRGFLSDFLPDIQIWENKNYISNPTYLKKDGDFEIFRRWAQNFYS